MICIVCNIVEKHVDNNAINFMIFVFIQETMNELLS